MPFCQHQASLGACHGSDTAPTERATPMSIPVNLIAHTSPLTFESDIATRSLETSDAPVLGELYFAAYDTGIAEASVEAARNAMAEIFAGKYGRLLPEASQAALDSEGNIVAAVLVVEQAMHKNAPKSPFLIELFTDRVHRRKGLAEHLVMIAADKLFQAGYPEVAVSVDDENYAALALYLSMEFRRWDGDDQDNPED